MLSQPQLISTPASLGDQTRSSTLPLWPSNAMGSTAQLPPGAACRRWLGLGLGLRLGLGLGLGLGIGLGPAVVVAQT